MKAKNPPNRDTEGVVAQKSLKQITNVFREMFPEQCDGWKEEFCFRWEIREEKEETPILFQQFSCGENIPRALKGEKEDIALMKAVYEASRK